MTGSDANAGSIERASGSSGRPARLLFLGVGGFVLIASVLGYALGPTWISAPARRIAESGPALLLQPGHQPSGIVQAVQSIEGFEWEADAAASAFALVDDPLIRRPLSASEKEIREAMLAVIEPHWDTLQDPSVWSAIQPGDDLILTLVDGEASEIFRSTRVVRDLVTVGHWAVRAGDTRTVSRVRNSLAAMTRCPDHFRTLLGALLWLSDQMYCVEEWARLAAWDPAGDGRPRPVVSATPLAEIWRQTCAGERRLILATLRRAGEPNYHELLSGFGEIDSRWDEAIAELAAFRCWLACGEIIERADEFSASSPGDLYESIAQNSVFAFSEAFSGSGLATIGFERIVEFSQKRELHRAYLRILSGDDEEPREPLRVATLEDGTQVLFDSRRTLAPDGATTREELLSDLSTWGLLILPRESDVE